MAGSPLTSDYVVSFTTDQPRLRIVGTGAHVLPHIRNYKQTNNELAKQGTG